MFSYLQFLIKCRHVFVGIDFTVVDLSTLIILESAVKCVFRVQAIGLIAYHEQKTSLFQPFRLTLH